LSLKHIFIVFHYFFIFLDIAHHIKGHSKTPKYSQSNLSCFLMQLGSVHASIVLAASTVLEEFEVGLFPSPLSRIIPCTIRLEIISADDESV